jgi:hypothetical protein
VIPDYTLNFSLVVEYLSLEVEYLILVVEYLSHAIPDDTLSTRVPCAVLLLQLPGERVVVVPPNFVAVGFFF